MNANWSKKILLILSFAISPALLAEASEKSFKVVNTNKPSETPIYVYKNGQYQFKVDPGHTRSITLTPGKDRLSYGIAGGHGQIDPFPVSDEFIASHDRLNYPADHNVASERQVKRSQALSKPTELEPVQTNQTLKLQ